MVTPCADRTKKVFRASEVFDLASLLIVGSARSGAQAQVGPGIVHKHVSLKNTCFGRQIGRWVDLVKPFRISVVCC